MTSEYCVMQYNEYFYSVFSPLYGRLQAMELQQDNGKMSLI